MTSEDPWEELAAPHQTDAISARRVGSELPWSLYWAKSVDDHCLLVLRHDPASSPHGKLPRFRGVEMFVTEGAGEGVRTLVLQLTDSAERAIFRRLCLDIVEATGGAPSEREAVNSFVAQTWRWHHLLRGGGSARLDPDEQRGLIGELIVLETVILPTTGVVHPVSTWRGPLGAPKDFEIGRICIEAKARRGAATPYVSISSEHQLDRRGLDQLFLYVSDVTEDQSVGLGGLTLTEIVARIRTAVAARDGGALEAFDDLLTAAGFRGDDDYSDVRWAEGEHRVFRVEGDFPALTAAACPAGVSNVRYSLDLAQCEPHRVTAEVMVAALSGAADGP